MENHDLIKVLLVDDHISVTYTLALALNVPPIRVVDVAGSAAEAIKLSHKVSPDVVVMDVRLSDDTGINATARLREQVPSVRILGYSASEEPAVIKAMFRSGALGYVSKSSLFSELVDGIIAVARGETFVSRSIAERLGKSSVSLLTADQQALSPSEEAVVRFIAEGLSNKEAASELGISARTVEKHRKSSMDKLEVKTVPALVKLAMKLGLISRD